MNNNLKQQISSGYVQKESIKPTHYILDWSTRAWSHHGQVRLSQHCTVALLHDKKVRPGSRAPVYTGMVVLQDYQFCTTSKDT